MFKMPWIRSCLCHQEKKRPTISPPIHLLLKSDGPGSQNHAFRCKVFKKPRPCHLCHQPILHQGSCCRVCKYVCHKVCESKDSSARYIDTSWQIYRQWRVDRVTKQKKNAVQTNDDNKPINNNGETSTIKRRVRIDSTTSAGTAISVTTDDVISTCSSTSSNDGTITSSRNDDTSDTLHTHDTTTIKNGTKVRQQQTAVMTSQPRPSLYGSGGGSGRSTSRSQHLHDGMDLSYVTERIIALWFPGDVSSGTYRQGQRQAAHMLHNKHADNYMVFNLSEPRRAARSEHERVREVGWPSDLAPPLERLCSVCKDIDSWLSADKHRIAVLHARGSRERLGVVVAAYMHYSSICGTADQALDRFAMRRFLDENVGAMQLPSNKRYVEYFSGLLSGNIRINAAPLYLTHVTVLGAPAFDAPGGCRAFLKVYEGLVPVYTSGTYNVNHGMRQFTVNVAGERQRRGLQLRGDILVKCYHRRLTDRETIFSCQFHTCAVSDYTLSFTRQELDNACNDLRFPLDGAVELHFSPTPEMRLPAPAPTPAVSVEMNDDPITRCDSYENLGAETTEDDSDQDTVDADVNHTYGPLDGSIYATIAKKPSDLSPGGAAQISSPLTVSMDSGISSAGHQHVQHGAAPLSNNTSNASSSSPPPAGAASTSSGVGTTPLTPEDRHRELDELLSDMLLTVENIPDLKPRTTSTTITTTSTMQRNNGDVRGGGSGGTLQQQSPHQRAAAYGGNVTNNSQYGSSGGRSCEETLNSVIKTLDSVSYIDDDSATDGDSAIPYHARLDSRPFTYGAPPPVQGDNMIGTQARLASPSLVRKASFGSKSSTPSNGIYDKTRNGETSTLRRTASYKRDPIDDIFTSRANDSFRRDERANDAFIRDEFRHDTLRRSNTEGTLRRPVGSGYSKQITSVTSPYSDSESLSPPGGFRNHTSSSLYRSPDFPDNAYSTTTTTSITNTNSSNLTWLQRQQQKLKERREIQLREERQPHETRLISELRTYNTAQHRHMRPTASHRLDGYTSDTTAFADDDDDFTIPLHINTNAGGKLIPGGPSSPVLPHRTSSRKYTTSTSTSSQRSMSAERPFVQVKRAHEQNRKYNESPTASGILIRPDSRCGTESIDSGLLSVVEHQEPSPSTLQRSASQRSGAVGIQSSSNNIDHHHHHQYHHINNNNNISHHSDALADLIANLANVCTSSPASSSSVATTAEAVQVYSDNSSDTTTNSPAWHHHHHQNTQYRDESFSSWRTASASEAEGSPPPSSTSPRPQTPAFPVHPRTPYVNNNTVQFDLSSQGGLPPKSPTTQRKDISGSLLMNGNTTTEYIHQISTSNGGGPPRSGTPSENIYQQHSPKSPTYNGSSSPTVYYGHSRRSSVHSNSEPPQEVPAAHVKFVRDTSKYWYKPTITREEAISMLRDQPPGTFVVRDSNSFPGAFGMALKVATPPANVQSKSNNGDELVRHFLIEPTSRGVRLKGCSNEPVFSSLSALVYQHSIMPLALPCRLLLPEGDGSKVVEPQASLSTAQQLLTQGAACNVLYLFTCDMESLTGPQAIRKAVLQLFMQRPLPKAAVVHFKVSGQGITLTDNKRKLFFRRHYPANTISHCGMDPEDHRWSHSSDETGMPISSNRCFGFVARKPASNTDNQCHVFAELEPEQPATAIVNFVSKVMMTSVQGKANIV